MTRETEPIGPLDLQAYGDGVLDRDPARKRQVEEWLRTRPAESARAWDYRVQNAMILERYGDVVAEAVPERLYRALDGYPRALGLARAAGVAAMIASSGVLGWWIGQGESRLAESRFVALLSAEGQPLQPAMETVGGTQPLGWLSDQITIPLQLPDLSALGYAHVGKRLVESQAGQAVEALYAGPEGERLVILLAPRWQEETSNLEFVERDGLRILYGFKGPVGYGLAGDLDEASMRQLAETVRRSWEGAVGATPAPIGIVDGGLAPSAVGPLTPQVPQVIRNEGAM